MLLPDRDMAYAVVGEYIQDHRPDWGSMSFLIDFLRPTSADGSWYSLLKRASGGCNDLLYSGHMLVAVLTAMAWTEAYGGWTSVILWMLVLHSGQREIRELRSGFCSFGFFMSFISDTFYFNLFMIVVLFFCSFFIFKISSFCVGHHFDIY